MALLKEFLFDGTVDAKPVKMRVFAQNKIAVPEAVRKATGGRSTTTTAITAL